MLIMINGDNKERDKTWRIVLDLHGVIVDSMMVVFFLILIASFILSWKPVEAWSNNGSYLLNTKRDNVSSKIEKRRF